MTTPAGGQAGCVKVDILPGINAIMSISLTSTNNQAEPTLQAAGPPSILLTCAPARICSIGACQAQPKRLQGSAGI